MLAPPLCQESLSLSWANRDCSGCIESTCPARSLLLKTHNDPACACGKLFQSFRCFHPDHYLRTSSIMHSFSHGQFFLITRMLDHGLCACNWIQAPCTRKKTPETCSVLDIAALLTTALFPWIEENLFLLVQQILCYFGRFWMTPTAVPMNPYGL